MSTELMNWFNADGSRVNLTRYYAGDSMGVRYQITVVCDPDTRHEIPVDGMAHASVDAETFRDMARCIEESEAEMNNTSRKGVLEGRVLDLEKRVSILENILRNLSDNLVDNFI